MRKLASIFSAAALAAAMAVTSFAPANSAPLPAPRIAADNGVINVQQSRAAQEFGQDRHWRGGRHWRGDRHYRGNPRYWGGGNRAFHNGHRGYRHHRPGYRYHNGFWFPAGAFVAGAILGGALNNAQPRYYRDDRPRYRSSGSAHVRWCYNRYRSYRDWDNTFQPYHGPRQQCYSPYS